VLSGVLVRVSDPFSSNRRGSLYTRCKKCGGIPRQSLQIPGHSPCIFCTHMDLRHAVDDLLEPAFVLPDQMSRRAACGARESATHRLMLGILRDAVDLYLKALVPGNRVAAKRLREVIAWFASSDRQWPFSFERICEALSLEPEYIRMGLHRQGRQSREAIN